MRPINDLRIVETLDKFQSIAIGYGKSSSLKYQTYNDLLINSCVRYDRTKKANIAKRGHIYQTTFTHNNDGFINQSLSETPARDPYIGINTPIDEFYTINTNQCGPPMSAKHKLQPRLLRSNPNTKPTTFPKNLPDRNGLVRYTCQDIYKLLSQDAKDALQKYNVEAIQKFKSSRNLHETTFIHYVHEDTQDNSHHPIKMMNFRSVKNIILTKIWNQLQMIYSIS